MTERERMLAGESYDPSDPELLAARAYCKAVLRRFTDATTPEAAADILGGLLGTLGEEAIVEPPLSCDYGWNVHLAPRAYVNQGVTILDCAPVTLGEAALVGPGVQLITVSHPLDPDQRRSGVEHAEPLTLEENSWIGAGAIILPGVTVGRNAVVGAGSVVTRDVPEGVLALGSPCRVVREL